MWQWAHICPGFYFVHDIPTEVLLVVLHIPCYLQLKMGFGFPNPTPAHCFYNIFRQGHLFLLPPLICFLFIFGHLCKLCHSCLTFCSLGWTILELGGSKPWKSPVLPDRHSFQDHISWDFFKQVPEQDKNCSSELQAYDSTVSSSQDLEHHHPTVIAGKAAPNLHVPHHFSLVCTYQVQQRASPCQLLSWLCQEASLK